jgi:hypothetical protein
VYDRGVPNSERIVLRANEPVDLSWYGLLLGIEGTGESLVPFRDQFLWLGKRSIESPGWVFVYTGAGQEGISQERYTKDPIHMVYWNKPNVILENKEIIPALIMFSSVQVGNKPSKSMNDLLERGHSELVKLSQELLRNDETNES